MRDSAPTPSDAAVIVQRRGGCLAASKSPSIVSSCVPGTRLDGEDVAGLGA